MGKSSFYLYGVSGKVGNLVARKSEDGKTVLAAYQPNVKNPQTPLQMAQRIILATVAQAIPQLYPIIDHSFEGFAVGAKSTREFRRLNLGLLRQYAAQDFNEAPKPVDATCFMTTKGIKALIPNKYQISSGSLSPTRLKISRKAEVDTRVLEVVLPTLSTPVQSDEVGQYFTLRDVMLKLFGITGSDEQLTFVAIQRSGEGYKFVFAGNDQMPGWVIPYTTMRAGRLVVAPEVDLNIRFYVPENPTEQQLESLWSQVIDDIMYAFQVSPRTDLSLWAVVKNFFDAMNVVISFDNGSYKVEFENGIFADNWTRDNETGLGHCYALGIIRSKLAENGKWQYSNTFMQTCGLAYDEYNYGLEWNSAIQAWFQTNEVAANDLYLKAGDEQNELGESYNTVAASPVSPLSPRPDLPWAAGSGGSVRFTEPISEEDVLNGGLQVKLQANEGPFSATFRKDELLDRIEVLADGDAFWNIYFASPQLLVFEPTGPSSTGPSIISITRV